MAALSKISEIISELKKQNKNEPDVKLTRLEIIFMDILQVLKTNIEEMKMRFAIERTFQEEKDYEDERRHREFIEVLKQFVSLEKPPTVIEEEKKEEGGFLDSLKKFLVGLVEKISNLMKSILGAVGKLAKLLKNFGKILLKVGKFLGGGLMKLFRLIKSPAVVGFLRMLVTNPWVVGALLASAGLYALYKVLDKDRTRITGDEAANVLESGTVQDVRLFAKRLNEPEKMFNEEELKAFKEEKDPEKKLLMYVNKYREKRKQELEDKKQQENEILKSFNVTRVEDLPSETRTKLKDMLLSEDERKESDRLSKPIQLLKDRVDTERFEVMPTRTGTGRISLGDLKQSLSNDITKLTEKENEIKEKLRTKPGDKALQEQLNDIKLQKEDKTERLKKVQDEENRRNQRETQLGSEIKQLENQQSDLQRKRGLVPGIAGRRTPEQMRQIEDYDKQIEDTKTQIGQKERERALIHTGSPGATASPVMSPTPAATPTVSPMPPAPTPSLPTPTESSTGDVSPVPTTVSSITPDNEITAMLRNAIYMNNDLNLKNTLSGGDVVSSVNNNGNSTVMPDIPMSVEASQRDDTPVFAHVMKRYKQIYV
jgi:hypothetical protein